MTSGRRVVVLTEDLVGSAMGGAAIRAYELARALGEHHAVTLAAPGSPPHDLGAVRYVSHPPGSPDLTVLLSEADAVVLRPAGPSVTRTLSRSGARIIFDLCDPLTLDILEARAGAPALEQQFWNLLSLDHLLDALHRGHHFICAGERQRDLYLGAMLAARLISPAAHAADPSFRSFIDCVPLGIPAGDPRRLAGVGPRAQIPGLDGDVRLIVWNGGIWNWLDPVTAVAAAELAHQSDPRVRLLFMFDDGRGGQERREARAARDLADRRGLLDRVVVFNERPIGYQERGSWLMDADCFVCTHRDHLEAAFSFRTRLLDAFWVGTPAISSQGGELAALIEAEEAGAVVAPQDPGVLAEAMLTVLDRGRDAFEARLRARGREMTWPRVAAPLKRMIEFETPPRALGAPLARRVSDPVRRMRALAARQASRLGQPERGQESPNASTNSGG